MFSLLWIWFMCHQGLWKGEDTKCRNTQDKELTETFITQQSRIQSQEEPKDQKHKVPTKRSKVQIRKSGITKPKVETRGGNNTTAHTHTHTHTHTQSRGWGAGEVGRGNDRWVEGGGVKHTNNNTYADASTAYTWWSARPVQFISVVISVLFICLY